ncbi:MAG: 3-hydroxybutyryl-CoA dehydrogenase [Anaerovoracaceae bacterium]|jgi:3-hydroxybutyryl-CoA dehydrogenase
MKIGVLGTGTMGAGIIQLAAQSGYEVVMRARRQTSIDNGIATVTRNLDRLVAKERITDSDKGLIMSRIHGSTDITIMEDADIIIEAATEEISSKKTLVADLDDLCKPETIIATNTSSLSITDIASATKRPDKIIGMHFFNPVHAIKLVEITKGLLTSEETRKAVLDLTESIGKVAIEVEESPGFVVNRLLIPMINEAAAILAEGVANAEDIDKAMQLGANHPMGPLAIGDMIGLDVILAIMEVFQKEFGEDKYRPHPYIRKLVRGGKLGRKTGEGFFIYGE